MHAVDKTFLVIGNKPDKSPRLLVVQQHQNFDVALSLISEMYAAGKARFHDVVKGFQRGIIVFGELKFHRPRFRYQRPQWRKQLSRNKIGGRTIVVG